MDMGLIKLIDKAIKAVPSIRYALGIAGIVAVIAIISSLKIDYRIAIFGTIIMLILMVILVIFTIITTLPKTYFKIPALIFIWFSLFIVIGVSILLIMSVFIQWPLELKSVIMPKAESSEIKVPQPPIERDALRVERSETGSAENDNSTVDKKITSNQNNFDKKPEIEDIYYTVTLIVPSSMTGADVKVDGKRPNTLSSTIPTEIMI